MRICVIGAGAIGGLLAAKLAHAGGEVSVVARGPHLAAMLERGLRVSSPEGDFEVRCTLRNVPLPRGRYYLWSALWTAQSDQGSDLSYSWRPVGSFDVAGERPIRPPAGVMLLSPVYVDTRWEVV